MKPLQNNYTTPEQSKRLLELGVPADSADGFYSRESYRGGKWERPKLFESEKDKVNFNSVYEGGIQMYLPLYTVGRLIEIYNECINDEKEEITIPKGHIVLPRVLILFFGALQYGWLDFSKLEDWV